jgi:5-formyltetrahydrofolate cyclo-ligase
MNLQKKWPPEQGGVLLDKRALRVSLKAQLRQFFGASEAETSASLDGPTLLQAQTLLAKNLCSYLKTQSGVWAGFKALPEEPDLSEVYQSMSHLTWVFPRVVGDELQFHITENFVTGRFGIQEPSPDARVVEREELQGLLIPGLGFDKLGHRLGRGRGFYDRALTGCKGVKVGVGFSCQVVANDLPAESHDVLMDALATETELRILRAG